MSWPHWSIWHKYIYLFHIAQGGQGNKADIFMVQNWQHFANKLCQWKCNLMHNCLGKHERERKISRCNVLGHLLVKFQTLFYLPSFFLMTL